MKRNIRRVKRVSIKAKILKNASMLFWKKGYPNTRIRDIAQACGFEAANLYHYYSSKEELLHEVLLEEINQTTSMIKHLADGSANPVERLKSLIRILVDYALSLRFANSRWLFDIGLFYIKPSHRKKIIEMRDTFDAIIRNIVLDGIKTGDFDEVDVNMANFTIISIIARSSIWYSPKGRLSISKVTDFIINFVLHGMTARKKRAP